MDNERHERTDLVEPEEIDIAITVPKLLRRVWIFSKRRWTTLFFRRCVGYEMRGNEVTVVVTVVFEDGTARTVTETIKGKTLSPHTRTLKVRR